MVLVFLAILIAPRGALADALAPGPTAGALATAPSALDAMPAAAPPGPVAAPESVALSPKAAQATSSLTTAEPFTELKLNPFQKVYTTALIDSIMAATCLLLATASGGAAIVMAIRWHMPRDGRRIPSQNALEREAAYASIFAITPKWNSMNAFAIAGAIAWIVFEGSLLLAGSSFSKKLEFDRPLELVAVSELVNLQQSIQVPVDAQSPPYRHVRWQAADGDVDAKLVIERFWNLVPLAKKIQAESDKLFEIIPSNYVAMWTLSDEIDELIVVAKANQTFTIGYATYAYLKDGGGDSISYVRWSGTKDQQLSLFRSFFIDSKNCTEKQRFPGPDYFDESEIIADCTEWLGALDDARAVGILVLESAEVLMDHVDLNVTDREGGFAASFPDRQDAALFGKSVRVGTVSVARLNLLSSAIVGALGILVYLAISNVDQFDATATVLEKHDAVKTAYGEVVE